MVPRAANLWVQSHDYERSQGMTYNRRLHKFPLFCGLHFGCFCRLSEYLTILADINDKTRPN
jgi:hypothetical protein